MAIKKSMVDVLAFITAHGNMSASNLAKFTADFCEAKGREATGAVRESVRLFDVDGNTIGRRCSILKLWMPADEFNGDVEKMSISRIANKYKTHFAREADKLVREGESIREEAKLLTDPNEKLAKFEEYDAILEKAKAVRNTEITPDMITEDYVGFESAEALAEEMDVDCITIKATGDDE